ALERLLKKEKDARVRLDTTGALYLLGQEDRLNEVLEYLSHREEDLRCAAANLLADLPARDDVESIERIEEALRNRTRSESSTLVLSILRAGMRTLRKLRASA
ncbi:MAG: hypothetical protein KAX37_08325, partial [Opitutaceae bacterium]|nr:hypothetical protein [Opitutaceae bacterium]